MPQLILGPFTVSDMVLGQPVQPYVAVGIQQYPARACHFALDHAGMLTLRADGQIVRQHQVATHQQEAAANLIALLDRFRRDDPAGLRPTTMPLSRMVLPPRFGPFRLVGSEVPVIAVRGRMYPVENTAFTLEAGEAPSRSLRRGLTSLRDRAAAAEAPQGWITLLVAGNPVEQHRFDLARDSARAQAFVAEVAAARGTAPD
ncbi:MAG: hypothetical protein ACK5LS_06005 [Propioniciclava sp.]